MTIRVKMRKDKAVVRFRENTQEDMWFQQVMVRARDAPGPHPQITVTDNQGRDIPKTPAKKLTPEQLEQMKKNMKITATPIGPMPQQMPGQIPQEIHMPVKEVKETKHV